MADTTEQVRSAFAAKAPQDLTAVTALAQPMAEKAAAYGRAVAGIVTETGTALSKAAEGKFADVQAQAVAGIEAAMKNAPAGSETAIAAFKNAMTTGQAALENVQAQAKQAVDAAGKNFTAATDMATKAAKSATKAK
jgi:phasin family protein